MAARVESTWERNLRNNIERRVEVINPGDKSWSRKSWVLWFGGCGTTYLLVYGDLDDALELAADWLADHAPGHLIAHDSSELQELYTEAADAWIDEHGRDPEGDEACAITEQATADLTYTEAGYLTSYEWGIALEDPSPARLRSFVKVALR